MIDLFKKVLVLAAHPDDEILGVGGTISKLTKKGTIVDILIFTDGSSTQYANDEEISENKFSEAERANKIVGTNKIDRFDFPDMRLDMIAHVDKNIALSKYISEGNYDTVFVQDYSDINKDHQELFESTIVACRPVPGQCVKYLLSYYVNSSTEWGNILRKEFFRPNVFVDISGEIENKLTSMKEYKTELREYPHPRSIDSIRNTAMYFGNSVGMKYSEAFNLILAR
ncbi:PIG-L family deacetylase [Labilibaculum sp. DW002]|uniref:PIG-L family deacetylase n=1 Tax=Paralabilibaculum antarcticum TaxID=2912572 RepID=A0ABT5VP58_9BACT|nr:PIG-L deacetylase family protein [Labilibaculum sp. DW002]MDE5417220.1 PIG-L family deacetylase [Labilibaculum sp. DW002]